jgi:hypothetical protein
MRSKRFADWLAEHEAARDRLRRLTGGLPRPYRRERPRDPEKARLLRERETPERLIGPPKR